MSPAVCQAPQSLHLQDFRRRRFAVVLLPKQSDRLNDLRDIFLA
jgi:hypothetical protein